MRIGFGYDSHRLVPGRSLILGGMEIPNNLGLLGHSDADVLIHAVCDAILGAICEGDIGKHFPDTDQDYKNVSSIKLLEIVGLLAKNKGFIINNVDCTIILESPKLMKHTIKMASNISRTLNISPEAVNVKAKTNEGMGLVGHNEGAAAFCVATVMEIVP
jgi:2-C-methyl-D-erythritol 2,4-cyclodiphosphate synthase